MGKDKNFEYLGQTFQLQLINQIIIDKIFGSSIIDVMEVSYFENKYFKIVVQFIKEHYGKYNEIPSFTTLKQIIKSELAQDFLVKVAIDTLESIKNVSTDGAEFVQEKALKFCKQQELKKVMTKAQKIIDGGEFENYDQVESLVRNALQVGELDKGQIDVFDDTEGVLSEDFRHPIAMGIKGIDKLLKGGLARGEIGVILAPTGVGKAQNVSEPILTPTGWTEIGNIKLGDKIIGSDGNEQYVIGVYPQGQRPIYKIEFTDDTHTFCDAEHLWYVNTLNMRTRKTRIKNVNNYAPNYGYKVIKTSDMLVDIKKRGRYNYRLPIVNPINFNEKDILINPYLLGILLGDGYLSAKDSITLSTKDDEIFDNIYNLNLHTSFSEYHRDTKTIKVVRIKNVIKPHLTHYGLLGMKSDQKFIPKDYIFNSVNNRLELLRGLMDTDGYADKRGCCQFTTVSEQLAKDVREIVLSLGGTAKIKTKIPKYKYKGEVKDGKMAYTVTISFANNIVPFKLLRKVNRFVKRKKYIEQKYIKSINYSHDEEAVCIKVSNPDELYVTRDYVLTHNTTVMTKIANHAYNLGFNVLQIFFEDNPKIIQRKHFTMWTGIKPDDLTANKEEVLETVKELRSTLPNKLILKKLPSESLTMSNIKNQVRKIISEGVKIDLICLDYIDCVLPEKFNGDEWKGEGSVIRAFEAMCHELDIVGWTATQGNRSSISADVVTTDQMGGSIKKAQVGHVIISIAKSLEQKDQKLATIAITKSRIGSDGVVFANCKFDNEMLIIDTEESKTLLGHEKEVEEINEMNAKKRLGELQSNKKRTTIN